jgi:hypothetical protein
MIEEELDIQLPKLEKKIPYDEDIFSSKREWQDVLNDLLEDSKSILLETLYPFNDFVLDETPIPKSKYNWQLRCCVELYNLADKAGIVNYSENGINWSKLTDGLSTSLMNKITSNACAPKSRNEE